MRRLWITRRKADAACLTKMKVYIEDPEGDTAINGFPCRKLGELKNGEKATFPIGYNEARIFVVADSLSKNLYNEFVMIPEGEEDVILSGRNVLKPFSGNPFRFDDVTDAATLANRNRVSARGSRTMLVAILGGILAGIAAGIIIASSVLKALPVTETAETFAAEELRITLTDSFKEQQVSGYTTCFASEETAVFILREDVSAMQYYGQLPLDVYGAMILANSGLGEEVRLQTEEGLTTFEASLPDPETGGSYYYYCGVFRSRDAYWLVQITTVAQRPQEQIPLFRRWLKSVTFAQ